MWYNNIVRREVKAMIDKIKELIKLLEQLNKLLLKVIELAGTVTLLVLAIKQIAEIATAAAGGYPQPPSGGINIIPRF